MVLFRKMEPLYSQLTRINRLAHATTLITSTFQKRTKLRPCVPGTRARSSWAPSTTTCGPTTSSATATSTGPVRALVGRSCTPGLWKVVVTSSWELRFARLLRHAFKKPSVERLTCGAACVGVHGAVGTLQPWVSLLRRRDYVCVRRFQSKMC